jgi:DinB superfamily
MKTTLVLFSMVAFVSFTQPMESGLPESKRTYAAAELRRTKQSLEAELVGLSSEQLSFKATPEKWSIAEIVEHLALSENGLFQIMQQSLKTPADSLKRNEIKVTDEQISRRLTNRNTKVKAPEVIQPTGKFPSVEAAMKAFTQRRDATIQYVSTTNDDLLNHFWQHPATGTIDLYQTMLLISAHSERHILQLREVKQSEGFPKK